MLAGVIICAVVAFWFVACSPALAQLSFSSSNQGAIKGRKPVAVVASNFNGDSGIDVATANQGFLFFGEGTDVLLGNGSGGFFDNQFEGDGGADSVAIGDFNGDGDIDLVLANCCSGDVSVLLGAGNGSFAAAVDNTVGSGCTPNSVVVGFFDSDRTPDLAVGSGGGCNVSILLGNGDGTFGAAQGVPVNLGVLPSQLATGDFNDDGNLDLVVGKSASLDGSEVFRSARPRRRHLLAGTGDHQRGGHAPGGGGRRLQRRHQCRPRVRRRSLVRMEEISIVLGNGNGTFDQQRFIQYPIGSSTTSVAVGDFNDDSVLDLATTDNLGNNDSGDVGCCPGRATGRSSSDPSAGRRRLCGDGGPL